MAASPPGFSAFFRRFQRVFHILPCRSRASRMAATMYTSSRRFRHGIEGHAHIARQGVDGLSAGRAGGRVEHPHRGAAAGVADAPDRGGKAGRGPGIDEEEHEPAQHEDGAAARVSLALGVHVRPPKQVYTPAKKMAAPRQLMHGAVAAMSSRSRMSPARARPAMTRPTRAAPTRASRASTAKVTAPIHQRETPPRLASWYRLHPSSRRR